MSRFIPNHTPCGRTRRELLWQVGGGFAGLALADLMASEALAASPLAEKRPHFPVKAKHCVFLFMNGGPSQVDTFETFCYFIVIHLQISTRIVSPHGATTSVVMHHNTG